MQLWYRTELVPHFEKLTWLDAEAHCMSNNGHLASVASLQDKKEVDDLIAQQSEYEFEDYIWLGGKDALKDGRWTWTSHTPWKVDFWDADKNEPYWKEDFKYLATATEFGKWEAWNSDSEYCFICRQKIVENGESKSFQKDDVDFSSFNIVWKTNQVNSTATSAVSTTTAMSTTTTTADTTNKTINNVSYTIQNTGHEQSRPNDAVKGGFKITWYVVNDETRKQKPDKFEEIPWRAVVEPRYETGHLLETVDMVSQGRRQNFPEISLWEKLLRQKWTKETVRDSSSRLNAEEIDAVLKNMNKDLSGTYSEALLSDEELVLGTELFFVLHYSFETIQESVKLSMFYEDLIKRQSLSTIVLATMNNVLPRTEAIQDFTGMVEFFNELDRLYDFTDNLTQSMMAISAEDQLQDLAHIGMPFIQAYRDVTTMCLEERDCNAISDVINETGNFVV